MRRADLILATREPIVAEWEAFARTGAPASASVGITPLRDPANEMRTVTAADLARRHGRLAQAEQWEGRRGAPRLPLRLLPPETTGQGTRGRLPTSVGVAPAP